MLIRKEIMGTNKIQFLFLVFLISCSTRMTNKIVSNTDDSPSYEADLAALQLRILKSQASTKPEEKAMGAKLLIDRGNLTGSYKDYFDAMNILNSSISNPAVVEKPFLLRAYLNYKIHRFKEARQDVASALNAEILPAAKKNAESLLADLDFNEGKYSHSRANFAHILKNDPTWHNIAKMAYFEYVSGHTEKADKLYASSMELLTNLQMKDLAWLCLQRGIMQLDSKNYAEALKHFEIADHAYPGYWLIKEHIAEAKGKIGQIDEAVEIYKEVLKKTDLPEYPAALAALLKDRDPKESQRLDLIAKKGFEKRYQLLPEAASGHWLDYLLTEENGEDSKLLALAQANLKLRPNAEAKIMLAKVYLKMNNENAARNLVCEVEKSPWRSPKYLQLRSSLGNLTCPRSYSRVP
jgi:tetratricopeptide (TPR) repeat protein